MCTVVILRRPDHAWPLIIGANRDEMRDRSSQAPARHWSDRPNVIAGRDLLANGTWLGMNDDGVICAVLNRLNSLGPDPDKRSRGELPLEALDHESAEAATEALSHIDPQSYRPFNLIIADADAAYWIACTGETLSLEAIDDGVHMITAFDLNSLNSPRMHHFLPLFRASIEPDPDLNDWRAWQALLASRHHDPESTGKGAMLVDEPSGFGTVSSSLIAVPARSRFDAIAHWHYADGPPDKTPWKPVPLTKTTTSIS